MAQFEIEVHQKNHYVTISSDKYDIDEKGDYIFKDKEGNQVFKILKETFLSVKEN